MKTIAVENRQRLERAVASLPPRQLRQLVDYAEYLSSREQWEATLELSTDPAMRRDVEEGREQAAQGKGRGWRDIQRSLRG